MRRFLTAHARGIFIAVAVSLPAVGIMALALIIPLDVVPIQDWTPADIQGWQILPRAGTIFFALSVLLITVLCLTLLSLRRRFWRVAGGVVLALAISGAVVIAATLTHFQATVTRISPENRVEVKAANNLISVFNGKRYWLGRFSDQAVSHLPIGTKVNVVTWIVLPIMYKQFNLWPIRVDPIK